MSDDFLRTQLRQAQDALVTAERLRAAAEAEYREALAKLGEIALSLLPAEWNTLRREHPDAASWPPQRLAGWIVDTGRRKLNRLEMLTQGDLAQELGTLTSQRDELTIQLYQTREALVTLEAEHKTAREQVQARDVELARLRSDIVEMRERKAEPEKTLIVATFTDDDLAAWQTSAAFGRDREALRVIGLHGFCLRAEVARAIGIADATSGTMRQTFDNLVTLDLLGQERPQSESVGQTPYLLRLTARGREVYQALFDEEAVESEYDRLLARHKSAEHVLLNLRARDVLQATGAKSVDLYPRPVKLSNGGTFDVDLVAVVDGKPLYVEAERSGKKETRVRKWTNYASVTEDFYIVVPNTDAKTGIISELSVWAYHNAKAAQDVTLYLCQLSTFDGRTPWQTVRSLGRSSR